MKSNIILSIFIILCCLIIYPSLAADSKSTVYQSTFSADPKWVTNNPSNDKWNQSLGRFEFNIEPSTYNYAYTTVLINKSFTLEYDINITKMDEGATFRMGLSDYYMDLNKGPIALTSFNTGKYGNLMTLRVVSPGNFLQEIDSQGKSIGVGSGYMGNTARFSLNKTYHVSLIYNDNTRIMTMKVSDPLLSRELWGYFIEVGDTMTGLDRIYMGSVGDYGQTNVYASGYIDNILLTTGLNTITTQTPKITIKTPIPTTAVTPRKTVVKTPTPTPTPIPVTTTAKTPMWVGLPLIALGYVLIRKN